MFNKIKKDYLDKTNRYYNLSTGAYLKYFGEHFHFFPWPKGKNQELAINEFNDTILKDGKLTTKSKIIELGCGVGSLSLLIASRFHCDITAVNINKQQIDIARKRAAKKELIINFIQEDIMELKGKNKLDTCFFIDVEPHLPDKHKAIKIINSLLRPGGRLVMTAWLTAEKPTIFQKELLIKPYCRLAAFPFMETFSNYKKYFDKENFKVVKFNDITEETRQVVNYYYQYALNHTKDYKSLKQAADLIKDTVFIKEILKIASKGELFKTAEDIFLGPIYTKLCMDAGLFKVGYFVLEKK